jgi:hypothetical protein
MNVVIRHGHQLHLMLFPGAFGEGLRQQFRISALPDASDQYNNPAHASLPSLLFL